MSKLAKACGCAVVIGVLGFTGFIYVLGRALSGREQSLPPVKSPNGLYVASVKAHLMHELSADLTITRVGSPEPVAQTGFSGIAEEGVLLGSVNWSPDSNRVAIVILDGPIHDSGFLVGVNAVYVYDLSCKCKQGAICSPGMKWSAGLESKMADKVFCKWQSPDKLQVIAQRNGNNVVPPVALVVTKDEHGISVEPARKP